MIYHRSVSTYHDGSTWPHLELGSGDDPRSFEEGLRAMFHAGPGWFAIAARWPALSNLFDDIDPVKVAAMTEGDVEHAA